MKLKTTYKPEDFLDYEIKEESETSPEGKSHVYRRVYFKNPFLASVFVGGLTIHNEISDIGEYINVPNPYVPEDCPENYNRYFGFFWSLPDAIIGMKNGYGDIIASHRGMFSIEMKSDVLFILDREIAAKKHEECLADWGKLDVDLDDVGYIVSVGFGFSSRPIVKILSDEELLAKIKSYFANEEEYLEKWNSYCDYDKDDFLMERYVLGNLFEPQHPATFSTYEEMQKVRNEFERVYRDRGSSYDYTGSSWELYSKKLMDTLEQSVKKE